MKRFFLISCVVLAALCLCACSPDPLASSPTNIATGAYATGVTQNSEQPGSWDFGAVIDIKTDRQPVGLLISGTASRGSLKAVIRAADGTTLWESAPLSGAFRLEELVETLPQGIYQFSLTWDAPVSATFEVYTVPGEKVLIPTLQPQALLGGVGMILVAIGFGVYASVKRLSWKTIGLGAFFWVSTVAVKFLLAIPLNPIVYKLLVNPDQPGLGDWIMYLYIGLLTGITEILLVWLFLSRTRPGPVPESQSAPRKRNFFRIEALDWDTALAFGIGFGAVEALLLGLNSLMGVLTGLLIPEQIPLSTLAGLATANHLLVGLAPVSERFFTIWIHILANGLLFYAAATRRAKFFWLAFWYKSLIDACAAYAQLTGLTSLAKLWAVEAVVCVFGFVGIWGMLRLKASFARIVQPSPQPELILDELH